MSEIRSRLLLEEGDGDLKIAHDLRQQAFKALREGRFDLAEEVLARGELTIETVVENLRIYHAELLIQNEELRRSQLESEEALARFTSFFNTLPIAELIVDRQGLIMDANPEASRVFALKPTHLHQHFFVRLIEESYRAQVLQAWSRLEANESIVLKGLRFRGEREEPFIGDLHVARLNPGHDNRRRLLCAVLDRTEEETQRRDLSIAYERLRDSEERYRVLAEFSPDWEYWTAADGDFLYVSPAVEEVTGYPAAEFVEDPGLLERLIHSDDREAWRDHFDVEQAESSEHGSCHLEVRLFDRDGHLHWIEHVCSPVCGDDGRDLGRRGVNRDITRRKLSEQAQARSDALLRATGHMARIGGWELDAANREMVWTDSMREIHQVDEHFIPTIASVLSFFRPDHRDGVQQAIDRALTEGTAFDLELPLVTARHQDLVVEFAGDPVSEGGRIIGLRGSLQDVSDRVNADQALREHEVQYRALFESASEGMCLIVDGCFTRVNQAALRLFGFSDEAELVGRYPWDLSPPAQSSGENSRTAAKALMRQALDNGAASAYWDHQDVDGRAISVELNLSRIELQGYPALFGVWRDLTGERAARDRELRAQMVFEKTSEGILFTDPDGHILMVNPAFTDITGYSEQEAIGQTPRILKSGQHDDAFYRDLWTAVSEQGFWRGELCNRRKTGEIYPQQSTISAVFDDNSELMGYIGVFGDLSSVRRSEEALYRLANQDLLTGLPNRAALRASLGQALGRMQRRGRSLALLFLDLDLFKSVNDTLGHPVGDRLLQQVSAEMAQALAGCCSVARVGGDEFAVIAEDIADPSVAARIALDILGVFKKSFFTDGQELRITGSIGISIFPADGASVDEMLSHADLAMYQAKEHGRNTYRFFEARMTEGAGERLQLENALRGARSRGQLSLVYQPQIGFDGESLVGVEVLLRWEHPELGIVSPGVFIPVAEEIGVIREMGNWVLEQALEQLAAWDQSGVVVPRIAVNLSVQQIECKDLVSQVREILDQTGLGAERLELEVTESMLMRHVDQATTNLDALREMGIKLAVDDFGSGYSSLRYLKRLPIDRLKIDRTFVEHLTKDTNDDTIVRAVIALGHSLGLVVLAEGVETREQADFLAREGCDEAQGYLYGRPVAAVDILARLRG